MRFRIASWNIREAVSMVDAQPYFPQQFIQDFNCDILALQEAPIGHPIVEELRTALRLSHATVFPLHRATYGLGMSGLVLMSRYPQYDVELVSFPGAGYSVEVEDRVEDAHDKGLMWVTCRSSEWAVRIGNMHLYPFQRMVDGPSAPKFSGVWREVRRQLAQQSTRATVLCGDFNTSDRDLAIPDSAGYTSVVAGRITHEGFSSDDILVSSHFRTYHSQLVDNPSDHLICIADLSVRSPITSILGL